MAKKALGKNLGALLGGSANKANERIGTEAPKDSELRKLPVDLIQPGKYQPRVDMHAESLEDLAESIRSQGVVQPIVVRPISDPGKFEIIAGERRWRATQLAGLDVIPALVRDVSDEAAIAMALIENIQREDLNPIEEAVALQRLQREFELTQQEVADAVGKSRSTVANLLRLMTLQEDVRRLVEHGDLEMGHARALLGLEGRAQTDAARQVVSRGLSVRETEKPFMMSVEDVFSISGRGTVATGRVERGIVKIQEEIEILGFAETRKTVVTGVEMFRKLLDEGRAGDNVGVLLRGIAKDEIYRGQCLTKPGSITPHKKFECEVYVLKKEEGGRHTPFFSGYRPQFYFRTTDVTGVVTLPEGTEMVMPGDNVNLTVELIAPIAMEKGVRFAIREGGRTVGAGTVTDIIE